jgi:hypothetical protein
MELPQQVRSQMEFGNEGDGTDAPVSKQKTPSPEGEGVS